MLQDFILRNGVMSLGGMTFPYAAKTANYTLTDEDYFIDCTSNTFTVTLPTAVGRPGQIYVIKNSGTGTITVATTSAQTIDGVSTKSLSQYNVLILASSGSGWAINSGPGSQGFQGSVGAQGNQGNQGVIGAQGNQGNQGVIGAQGNQGNQGNQGTQGNQGNQGTQGNQGSTGIGDKIYLANNFGGL